MINHQANHYALRQAFIAFTLGYPVIKIKWLSNLYKDGAKVSGYSRKNELSALGNQRIMSRSIKRVTAIALNNSDRISYQDVPSK